MVFPWLLALGAAARPVPNLIHSDSGKQRKASLESSIDRKLRYNGRVASRRKRQKGDELCRRQGHSIERQRHNWNVVTVEYRPADNVQNVALTITVRS